MHRALQLLWAGTLSIFTCVAVLEALHRTRAIDVNSVHEGHQLEFLDLHIRCDVSSVFRADDIELTERGDIIRRFNFERIARTYSQKDARLDVHVGTRAAVSLSRRSLAASRMRETLLVLLRAAGARERSDCADCVQLSMLETLQEKYPKCSAKVFLSRSWANCVAARIDPDLLEDLQPPATISAQRVEELIALFPPEFAAEASRDEQPLDASAQDPVLVRLRCRSADDDSTCDSVAPSWHPQVRAIQRGGNDSDCVIVVFQADLVRIFADPAAAFSTSEPSVRHLRWFLPIGPGLRESTLLASALVLALMSEHMRGNFFVGWGLTLFWAVLKLCSFVPLSYLSVLPFASLHRWSNSFVAIGLAYNCGQNVMYFWSLPADQDPGRRAVQCLWRLTVWAALHFAGFSTVGALATVLASCHAEFSLNSDNRIFFSLSLHAQFLHEFRVQEMRDKAIGVQLTQDAHPGLFDAFDQQRGQAILKTAQQDRPHGRFLAQPRFYTWSWKFLALILACAVAPEGMSPVWTMLLWHEAHHICFKWISLMFVIWRLFELQPTARGVVRSLVALFAMKLFAATCRLLAGWSTVAAACMAFVHSSIPGSSFHAAMSVTRVANSMYTWTVGMAFAQSVAVHLDLSLRPAAMGVSFFARDELPAVPLPEWTRTVAVWIICYFIAGRVFTSAANPILFSPLHHALPKSFVFWPGLCERKFWRWLTRVAFALRRESFVSWIPAEWHPVVKAFARRGHFNDSIGHEVLLLSAQRLNIDDSQIEQGVEPVVTRVGYVTSGLRCPLMPPVSEDRDYSAESEDDDRSLCATFDHEIGLWYRDCGRPVPLFYQDSRAAQRAREAAAEAAEAAAEQRFRRRAGEEQRRPPGRANVNASGRNSHARERNRSLEQPSAAQADNIDATGAASAGAVPESTAEAESANESKDDVVEAGQAEIADAGDAKAVDSASAAAAAAIANKRCANCGATKRSGDSTGKTKLLKCGGCMRVYYCGRECMKQDWARHKLDCRQQSASADVD